MKEPALFLQIFFYAVCFIWMVYFLLKVQKKTNDQQIHIEKCYEEIHATEEARNKKAALTEALNKKIDRYLGLQRFSEELKAITEVQDAAQKVVNETSRIFPKADECALYLVDESRQELSLVAAAHAAGKNVKEKGGTLFDHWVLKRSIGVMIEDAQNDFRFPSDGRAELKHLRSICVSPLMTENRVLGVVRISAEEPDIFSSDDLRLLDIFSSLGAVTLKNILLYQKMGELAVRDSLTGLYLNRYFQERLAEEIQRSHASDTVFALILLDIDHFKNYNDAYGHSAGDIVLRSIASVISGCLEPIDLAARYGGEEFIMLLPNKGKKEAIAVAERIRSEIEKYRFSIRRAEKSVTASIGVASFPKSGNTKDELIWRVDKNLYEAKNSGRNRVCGNI